MIQMLVLMTLAQSGPRAIDAAKDDPVPAIRTAFAEERDADVVVLSDRALLEATGRTLADVHFLRGAALRRMRRPEEALVALEAARRVGYAGPELHLERALALSAAGRQQEAEQEMDEVRKLLQESPDALDLFEQRWRRRQDSAKRFELRVRPQIGYDTNIVGVNDDALLAEDVDLESVYYGVVLGAKYKILEEGAHFASVEYQNSARVYSSEPDLSYTDNLVGVNGRVGLQDWLSFHARVALSEAFLSDEGHFRTLRTAAPAFLVRIATGLEARLWAEWGDVDYYFNGPAEQDRDGSYQQIGLTGIYDIGGGWSVSPTVSYMDYDADGADYDRVELQAGILLALPETLGVRPTIAFSHVWADFDEPNSLTGFADERRDRRIAVTLTLAIRSLEPALGFAPTISIRFEDWGSNIDAYEFRRWQPQIDFSFLAYSF